MPAFKIVKIPSIVEVFNQAQQVVTVEPLSCQLIHIFNKTPIDEFTEAFITCLKIALCVPGEVNVSVDKVFEFATHFIITVAGLDASDNSNVSEESLNFVNDIFSFFKTYHDVPSPIVRKRICQFISKLLLRMSPDAELDMEICNIIVEMMKIRIKDKVPAIRSQAILAAYRLQDLSDKNCPITQLLLECIESDTSAEIRRLALSKITLMHKHLNKIIIDRIDDISEKVRKEAYMHLSKLYIKQFSIEQRKRLLSTGLYDNNEAVKNAVKNVLLPAWLKRLDNNYLDLLKALDLKINSIDVATKALMALFHNTPHERAKETLQSLLDNIRVISFEKLTPEAAFFWRCYVFFASNMVNEKDDYHWESSKSYPDATIEGLLPDLNVFCDYIKMYYTLISTETPEKNSWKREEHEFILIQLVELCKVYDYADEVGRKELKTLCLELMKHVKMETIKPVVELYFMLQTNLGESISNITELINDLLYPNCTGNATMKSCPVINSTCIDPAQEQDIKFKIAQLNVKINELKDLQDEAIKSEDFGKAQELKSEISECQDKVLQLKASLMGSFVSSSSEMMEEDEDEEEIRNPLENVDTDTIQRCLMILQHMLDSPLIKQLTPELRTLFQMLVLPACKSENCAIAPLATEVLGSCCIRDKALAMEYFTTLFALCSNSDICVNALKAIFDFLRCFGPNTFKINNLNDSDQIDENPEKSQSLKPSSPNTEISLLDAMEDVTLKNVEITTNQISNNEESNKTENPVEEGLISGYTFISVLVDLLDDEFVEARFTVVHGLCQLMATGKLKSVKVLTRLILIWFHPASKDSVEIRDCLNYFFPFFIKQCSWSLHLFENAFIPTMDILFNAPSHNPLSTVDQKCVLKVLCDLTSPNFAHDNPQIGENTHFNVAVLFCNSIMDLKDSNHQAILLKGLDYLDLSYTEPSMLPTLANLIAKIIKKFTKKNIRKLATEAKKFESKLASLIAGGKKVSSVANSVCWEQTIAENGTIEEE